jgi:hypothetical protein
MNYFAHGSHILLCFVNGWLSELKDSWGKPLHAKNLTYYGVLYLTYLLGPVLLPSRAGPV